MKKLKGLMSVAVVLLATIVLAACGGTSYTKLEVEHTQNLEFLVGEEYNDDQIKAIATLSDDTTEDVTSKVTIDTSEYNKNVVGKYKIYFTLDDITENYEVAVVNRITTVSTINTRFSKVISTSFGTGAYSFEMSNTTNNTGMPFTQIIKHSVDASGNIASYVKWVQTNNITDPSNPVEYTWMEMWYNGTATNGTITRRTTEDFITYTVEAVPATFATFNTIIESSSANSTFFANDTVILIPGNVDALKTSTPTLAGELTKSGDVYTITGTSQTFTYKNNVLTSIDGVGITFNQTVIPTVPAVTE